MNAKIDWLTRQIAQSPHTNITGFLGEQIIKEALKKTKYRGIPIQSSKNGDMHIVDTKTGEIIKAEIKTAKRTKNGYQFCLRKNDKYGQTNIDNSDIVILLCVGLSGLFIPHVVPKKFFGNQKKACIRSLGKGKYSEYQQSINSLNFVV